MRYSFSKLVILAFVVPAVLFGVPFLVFYFTIGPEILYATDLWLWMGASYAVFGALALVAKLVSDRTLTADELAWSDSEVREGKWRFAARWSLIVTANLAPALALSYAGAERKDGDTGMTAIIILLVVAAVGSFLISLEIWKFRDRISKKKLDH